MCLVKHKLQLLSHDGFAEPLWHMWCHNGHWYNGDVDTFNCRSSTVPLCQLIQHFLPLSQTPSIPSCNNLLQVLLSNNLTEKNDDCIVLIYLKYQLCNKLNIRDTDKRNCGIGKMVAKHCVGGVSNTCSAKKIIVAYTSFIWGQIPSRYQQPQHLALIFY